MPVWVFQSLKYQELRLQSKKTCPLSEAREADGRKTSLWATSVVITESKRGIVTELCRRKESLWLSIEDYIGATRGTKGSFRDTRPVRYPRNGRRNRPIPWCGLYTVDCIQCVRNGVRPLPQSQFFTNCTATSNFLWSTQLLLTLRKRLPRYQIAS